jgi:hypothetical protein
VMKPFAAAKISDGFLGMSNASRKQAAAVR